VADPEGPAQESRPTRRRKRSPRVEKGSVRSVPLGCDAQRHRLDNLWRRSDTGATGSKGPKAAAILPSGSTIRASSRPSSASVRRSARQDLANLRRRTRTPTPASPSKPTASSSPSTTRRSSSAQDHVGLGKLIDDREVGLSPPEIDKPPTHESLVSFFLTPQSVSISWRSRFSASSAERSDRKPYLEQPCRTPAIARHIATRKSSTWRNAANEQLVMLAISRCRRQAYALAIQEEIGRHGHTATLGVLYTVLARLERRQLVRHRDGDATPECGDRPKHFCALNGAGAHELRGALRLLGSLRTGA
jgi:hypothetical protein